MINQEFQELKRQWSLRNPENEKIIIENMRYNLLSRNGGSSIYTTGFSNPGISHDINTCDVESLFAIDADMNPQGL